HLTRSPKQLRFAQTLPTEAAKIGEGGLESGDFSGVGPSNGEGNRSRVNGCRRTGKSAGAGQRRPQRQRYCRGSNRLYGGAGRVRSGLAAGELVERAGRGPPPAG